MTSKTVNRLEINENDIRDCLALMDQAGLSAKPRAVMCALLSTPGYVSRKELMDHVYGDEDGPFERTLVVYIYHIRAALAGSRFDLNVRYGYGYELVKLAEANDQLVA